LDTFTNAPKVLLAVAKENNLDIELVETRPPDTTVDYLKLNPLNRVPTFVGADGFVLTEVIAIAIYCESLRSTFQPLAR
jgi:elongation factor 1-gamma